jgi:hypothetical protein
MVVTGPQRNCSLLGAGACGPAPEQQPSSCASLGSRSAASSLSFSRVLPRIQGRPPHRSRPSSWLMTTGLLAGAVGVPVTSRLADMHGRRRLLVVTLAVLHAGPALGAVTDVFASLVLARALQGIALMRDVLSAEKIPGVRWPCCRPRWRSAPSPHCDHGPAGRRLTVAGGLPAHLGRWGPTAGASPGESAAAERARHRPHRRHRRSAAHLRCAGLLRAMSMGTTWGGERRGPDRGRRGRRARPRGLGAVRTAQGVTRSRPACLLRARPGMCARHSFVLGFRAPSSPT